MVQVNRTIAATTEELKEKEKRIMAMSPQQEEIVNKSEPLDENSVLKESEGDLAVVYDGVIRERTYKWQHQRAVCSRQQNIYIHA